MMNVSENESRILAMLRYQAARYQAARNGAMCQQVNAEIRRLLTKAQASAANA